MTTTPGNPPPFQPQGPESYQTGGNPPPVPHQGPGSHQTGDQPPGSQPSPVVDKGRNIIAIVALVAAIVGFVFAVWEGAYLLGWILLPIAFVLSLVALFQRDKPKKLAVAALIISIVGTIAGVIAFTASTITIVDEAMNTDTTISETAGAESEEPTTETNTTVPSDAEGEPSDGPSASDEELTAEQGTRENPVPLGSTISSDDWEVTVNSFTADATAEVMAENQLNDEPDAGFVYALVNVTLKRVAAEAGYPLDVSVSFVTAAGNVVNEFDALAVVPEDLGSSNELYEGAEVTGNVGLMIPEGDAGTIRVSPGMFADEVFFATS